MSGNSYTYSQFKALNPKLIKTNVGSKKEDLYECPYCLMNTGKKKNKFYWNARKGIGKCYICLSNVWEKVSIETICQHFVEDKEKHIEQYQYWDIKNWTYPIQQNSEQYQYLINRGIDQNLITKYNIKYCNVPYSGIVLPNGLNDTVNFFQVRNLNPKAKLRYVNPSSLKPVYGDFIPKHSNTAMICEGVLSCISTDSNQYNSYALYGKSPSDHQIQVIKDLNYDEHVICLDGGEILAILELAKKLIKLEKPVSIILLPYKKDPNDCKQYFNKFYNNSRFYLSELGIKIMLNEFKSVGIDATEQDWLKFFKTCANFNKNC